jgi:hypothetical protein
MHALANRAPPVSLEVEKEKTRCAKELTKQLKLQLKLAQVQAGGGGSV